MPQGAGTAVLCHVSERRHVQDTHDQIPQQGKLSYEIHMRQEPACLCMSAHIYCRMTAQMLHYAMQSFDPSKGQRVSCASITGHSLLLLSAISLHSGTDGICVATMLLQPLSERILLRHCVLGVTTVVWCWVLAGNQRASECGGGRVAALEKHVQGVSCHSVADLGPGSLQVRTRTHDGNWAAVRGCQLCRSRRVHAFLQHLSEGVTSLPT